MTSSTRSADAALFVSVPQAAVLLGVSERLVYELTERGDLPSTRLGRRKVVPRRAIELVEERALANFDPDALLVALASAGDSSGGTTPAAEEPPGRAGAEATVVALGRR